MPLDYTLENPAALYNHESGIGGSVLQFESFQYRLSSEENILPSPNPPNADHQVCDNGSDIEEDTVICFGMVSILLPTYYDETCMALTL